MLGHEARVWLRGAEGVPGSARGSSEPICLFDINVID